MKQNRRSFITTAGLALPAIASSRAAGSNERVRLGLIGVGGRGAHTANWFSGLDGVEIASLCDPDTNTLGKVQKKFPDAKATTDLRRLIEDKDIDAVVISTCNHWHALAAIWAIQAGKDVYVEKPVSHNVWEGRKIVEGEPADGVGIVAGNQHPPGHRSGKPDPDGQLRGVMEVRRHEHDVTDLGNQAGFFEKLTGCRRADLLAVVDESCRNRPVPGASCTWPAADHQNLAVLVEHNNRRTDTRIAPVDVAT